MTDSNLMTHVFYSHSKDMYAELLAKSLKENNAASHRQQGRMTSRESKLFQELPKAILDQEKKIKATEEADKEDDNVEEDDDASWYTNGFVFNHVMDKLKETWDKKTKLSEEKQKWVEENDELKSQNEELKNQLAKALMTDGKDVEEVLESEKDMAELKAKSERSEWLWEFVMIEAPKKNKYFADFLIELSQDLPTRKKKNNKSTNNAPKKMKYKVLNMSDDYKRNCTKFALPEWPLDSLLKPHYVGHGWTTIGLLSVPIGTALEGRFIGSLFELGDSDKCSEQFVSFSTRFGHVGYSCEWSERIFQCPCNGREKLPCCARVRVYLRGPKESTSTEHTHNMYFILAPKGLPDSKVFQTHFHKDGTGPEKYGATLKFKPEFAAGPPHFMELNHKGIHWENYQTDDEDQS